jgi:hypothetical protein
MPRTTATPGAMLFSAPQCTFYSSNPLRAPDSRKDDDFSPLPYMYTAPPCVYKRGRWALSSLWDHNLIIHTHVTRRTHSILSLASIISSSSKDLGAFLPLSPHLYPLLQASPVQDSTVHSHSPLLDVRPRGQNQDKPVRSCVTSCINHLG